MTGISADLESAAAYAVAAVSADGEPKTDSGKMAMLSRGRWRLRVRRLGGKQMLALCGVFAATIMFRGGRGFDSGMSADLSDKALLRFDPEGESSPNWISRLLTSRKLSLTITDYDTSQEYEIPQFYDNIANVWDTITLEDQPMLFYVPGTGGSTMSKIFSHCLEMVTAGRMAGTDPSNNGLLPANEIVVNTHSVTGAQYINIDVTTFAGISRAISQDLATDRKASVILTQRLNEASGMFTGAHKGRLFVMLRHPIKRIVNQFYYRQRATWEADYDTELAGMSLEDYAQSDKFVDNFVVRSLLNKVTEDISPSHVETAKHILRRKFLVGVTEWFDLSLVRFERYFGWWDDYSVMGNTTVNYCHHRKIMDHNPTGTYPTSEPGSVAYQKIAVRNWADFELYFYAKNLFYQQASLV